MREVDASSENEPIVIKEPPYVSNLNERHIVTKLKRWSIMSDHAIQLVRVGALEQHSMISGLPILLPWI
jgi:hypothetical protein